MAPSSAPVMISADYPPNIPDQDAAPAPSIAVNAEDDVPIEAGEDLLKAIELQGIASSAYPDEEDIDIPEPVSAGVSRSDGL